MKSKILSLLIILIFSEFTVLAQASWTYTIWFNLENQAGNIMSKEDFIKNEIKLLSMPFGAHSDNKLKYDTLTSSFRFSQHTITTSSVLVFIQGEDTTTIEIGTQDLYLDRISLTGRYYKIRARNNEDHFICNDKLPGYKNRFVCKNKYPFNSYILEKKETIDFDKLIEVKFE